MQKVPLNVSLIDVHTVELNVLLDALLKTEWTVFLIVQPIVSHHEPLRTLRESALRVPPKTQQGLRVSHIYNVREAL